MVIKKLLERLLPDRQLEKIQDLVGWRVYYIELMLFCAIIAIPVGLVFAIPTYLAEGKWELIVFNIAIIIILALVLSLRHNAPLIKTFFLTTYGMTLTFIIVLGPYYARPGWLVMCVVSAAFLFGVRAAIVTTVINFLILMALYLYAGPYLPDWAAVYQDPFKKWIMFCANLSLISLLSGLPVGFLLNQMNRILNQKQDLIRQLARESEDLQATNRQLQNEISQRNKAEVEKKHLEMELIQAQKMEAVGTMAGGIAHDFNNILSAIIGYAQLTLDHPSDTEKTRYKVAEILKAGERAKALVKQILAFSRKSEIQAAPLDLTATVTEALKMMRALIPSNVKLNLNLIDSGRVLSSSTHIHQILMNLCQNGIQAMGADGGSLNIFLTRETLSKQAAQNFHLAAGRYLKLTVQDTGPGMSPEITARVFEPYFTTKGMGSGTGLGLSVVHGIVKSHDGVITCQSSPGRGTSFDVYLPEINQEIKSPEKPAQTKMPTGTGTILYVDDEDMLVDVANQMLNKMGYQVVTQTSSIAALNLFAENPGRFDAVITDMTMPQLTGDKLAQKMLALRPDVPIIICTGYSEHLSDEDAVKLGIREFLMKPYDMPQLADAVRRAMDSNAVS